MTARVVIAGTSSGAGKTTVATGLLAALKARGIRAQGFKVGPDFIDPGYHALATARPGRNLDAFLQGPELIAPLFRHGAHDADVAVIEGVMGLFDGASGRGELASTAHVAKLLRAPVVLVVDASAMARSVAAIVHGYRSFDPDVNVAGVVLNRVGSERHELLLREALAPLDIPVLGALRRDAGLTAPERHLGLVPVAERVGEARDAIDRLGALVARDCDLEGLERLARTAPEIAGERWSPEVAASAPAAAPTAAASPNAAGSPNPAASPNAAGSPNAAASATAAPPRRAAVVAVAQGPAFSFHYAEHAELLEAAGARVVPFDPLHDEALPPRTGALLLAGGFPEVHADALSDNWALRAEIAAFARAGRPVVAECGGLLYLCSDLDGKPMCDVLAASARMEKRLMLGYREATAATDSPAWAAGTKVRGHEFHHSRVEPRADAESPAWTLDGHGSEGFLAGGVHASYLHTHWAATPDVAQRLVRAAAAARPLGAAA